MPTRSDTPADTVENQMKLHTLNNITLKVEISKALSLRLKLFMLLMRIACWVGTVGIEFVANKSENTDKN